MIENLVYKRIGTATLVIVKRTGSTPKKTAFIFVGCTKLDSTPGGGLAAGPLRSAALICSGNGEEAVVAMKGYGGSELYDQVDGMR